MLAVPYIFKTGISHFFQSSINVSLAQAMPLPLFRLYCYTLGCFYFSVRSDYRQQVANGVLTHMSNGNPSGRDLKLVLRTYQGIFEHYIEKMLNAYHPTRHLTKYLNRKIDIQNEHWLKEALRARKGVLMVTGHFGAVEYMPLFLSLKGYETAMIMRFKTECLRRKCQYRCKRYNVWDIDADRPNVAFKALNAIRHGRILITLCDDFKHWRPHSEHSVTVFGNQVRQDKTLNILYKRYKPPACLGLIIRHRRGFTLCIDPITNGDDATPLAERSWQKLELYIRQYPEQWYQWRQVADRLATYRLKE